MSTKIFIPGILSIGIMLSCTNKKGDMETYKWPNAEAPVAEIKPHKRILHGDTVTDNYYWMIDYFKKGPDSDKVVDYLTAENRYLDTMMSGSTEFRANLFKELKGRIKEKDESVPVFHDGYFYYSKTEDGKQYFKYCRKKGTLEATEEVLLDVDEMAKDLPYYSATGFSISPNNKFLAFGVDKVSRREYTLHIKNLETGEILKDAVENTEGDPVWAADDTTLFYTAKNPVTLLSEKIKKHKLGSDAKQDVVVYEEQDNSNYIGVSKSKSGKYIFIHSSATMSDEMRMINANQPDDAFKLIQPRIKDVKYEVIALEDKFLIVTNWEAKNFRLMECPLDKTSRENWKEVIPNREDVLLSGVDEFKDFLVISERKNGLEQLHIRSLVGPEHNMEFEEPTYAIRVASNPEYDSRVFRYIYTSMTTPVSTYDYNMVTKEKKLMKQQEVVGGYQKEDYVTERHFATAKDGTTVPISLVYKKGLKKDGTAPLLLYAYGSYGRSMDAAFSSNNLSLLNRGFVYAIAHIRGGQEMGRHWYDDGKLMKKMNTFTDFMDCGKFLMDQKYTGKGHLYAQGGSAGGLLMGAVINLDPDLWNGIIAQVPFVDVVNTMLDESIPLTTNEFDEWGNPKEKAAYQYMKSYAPYENIEKKAYPNMLVTTGLHDSQVQYFEPAKWVAKLRANKTDNHVLLLKTDMDFGHGGASGRFDYLKDIALNYAFLFSLENIRK
jgi:oligopeptidase B